MRVRMLRDIGTAKAGQVLIVKPWLARQWIAQGKAMEDKSIEAKETK